MLQWLNTIVTWWAGKVPALPPAPEVESPELIALKKAQYQDILAKSQKASDDRYKRDKEEYEKNNSVCPKCGHTVVVEHIQRIQGKIDGHTSGGIFGFAGSLHGSMDTNEVNFCTKCTHQWKKVDIVNYGGGNLIDVQISWLRINVSQYKGWNNVVFDPTDITEKFSSKEEKIKHLYENYASIRKRTWDFWKDTSIEVIQTFALVDMRAYPDPTEYVNEKFPAITLHDLGYRYAKEMLPV